MFPELAFAFEVEVEGLVVGAVPEVVADVALAEEVERGGEEEGQKNSDGIVDGAARVEDSVLGLVEHGVGGVHDEGVGDGERGKPRPEGDGGGGVEDGEHGGGLERGDAQVGFGGDGESFGHGVMEKSLGRSGGLAQSRGGSGRGEQGEDFGHGVELVVGAESGESAAEDAGVVDGAMELEVSAERGELALPLGELGVQPGEFGGELADDFEVGAFRSGEELAHDVAEDAGVQRSLWAGGFCPEGFDEV